MHYWKKIKSSKDEYFILQPEIWAKQGDNCYIQKEEVAPTNNQNVWEVYTYITYFVHTDFIGRSYSYNSKIIKLTDNDNLSTRRIFYFKDFERPVLHNYSLVRNGVVISDINDAHILTSSASRTIQGTNIKGRSAIELFMPSIQPGDQILFNYTLYSRNPDTHPKISDAINFGAFEENNGPITFTVFTPKDYKFYTKINCKEITHTKQISNEYPEYVKNKWFRKKTENVKYEPYIPITFLSAFPSVTISEYRTWDDVRTLINNFFSLPNKNECADALLRTIVQNKKTVEEKLIACVNYVQKSIGYKVFDEMQTFIKPNTLDYITKNTIGDCKDKTFLLCYLLSKIGIKATPTLVNIDNSINDQTIPCLHVFDHVICSILFQEKLYYVDPTLQFDAGTLENRFIHQYDFVLPLDPQQIFLLKPSNRCEDSRFLHETYDFRNYEKNGHASLTIVSRYTGGRAIIMRENYASKTLEEIQEGLLGFYQTYYPDISFSSMIEFKDDEKENALIVTETYNIPDISKLPINENNYFILPEDSFTYKEPLEFLSQKRAHPLSFTGFFKEEHVVEIHSIKNGLPDSSDTVQVNNNIFCFRRTKVFKNNTLQFKRTFKPKETIIKPEDFQQCMADYDVMKKNAVLLFSQMLVFKKKRKKKSFLFSWLFWVIGYMFLKLFMIIKSYLVIK